MLGKPLLFMSSYAPLFALLAIRFSQHWLWITCLILAVFGTASLLLLLLLDRRASPGPHEISTVKQGTSQAASYLASYLLPFVTVSTPSTRDVIAYAGFLAIAATIHLRSSIIEVNPLLYILGYRILEVADDRGFNGYLVTRRRIMANDRIVASRFRDEVLIDRTPRPRSNSGG